MRGRSERETRGIVSLGLFISRRIQYGPLVRTGQSYEGEGPAGHVRDVKISRCVRDSAGAMVIPDMCCRFQWNVLIGLGTICASHDKESLTAMTYTDICGSIRAETLEWGRAVRNQFNLEPCHSDVHMKSRRFDRGGWCQ